MKRSAQSKILHHNAGRPLTSLSLCINLLPGTTNALEFKMTRFMRTAALLGLAGIPFVAALAATDQVPTYSKDIAPIMQTSCQRCHNPNSVAPTSFLTYEQVRPFAREIKRRTALKYAPASRGVMPPWFLEANIGIQHMEDDISLSDAQISMIAKWADNGAPRGNPADEPKPLSFADPTTWQLGKPDLIVSTPTIFVAAIAADWGGSFGKTPLGLDVDRYAKSSEWQEQTSLKKAGAINGGRFVFHHATTSISGPDDEDQDAEQGESSVGPNSFPIHEVGRNGDVFPEDAGKLLPAGGFINWGSMHIHSAGSAGSERYARLDVGVRLHPLGYKPTRQERPYTFGRTELQMDPNTPNQREDAYFVAPSAMKLTNFEPHLHTTGVRMCLQAIIGRSVETLNCSGYDHNWVRNYQYTPGYEPLIPKGTILHAISWTDNTASNNDVMDPRNTSTFGNSSTSNMFIMFNLAEFLSDEDYAKEVQMRKEFLALTHQNPIGCIACYLPPAKKPAPKTDAKAAPKDGAAPATAPAAKEEAPDTKVKQVAGN